MSKKIPKTYRIHNKQGKIISESKDNVHIAWLLADAILRPDVNRTKYPMQIDKLKGEGYYSTEVCDEQW